MEKTNDLSNRKKYIPIDTDDLYLKLKKQNLKGILSKKEVIVWKLQNSIIIEICVNDPPHEGYIGTYYLKKGKKIPLTHWHPMEDEIYDDLMDINFERVIWVKKKTIFGESVPIIMDRMEYENMSEKKKRKYTIL